MFGEFEKFGDYFFYKKIVYSYVDIEKSVKTKIAIFVSV